MPTQIKGVYSGRSWFTDGKTEQITFHQIYHDVTQGDVGFLYSCGVWGRNRQDIVQKRFHHVEVRTQESDGSDAKTLGGLASEDDVLGVAAGGKTNQYITGMTQSLHLPGKNLVKAIVVAGSGEGGRVGGQSNRG